MIAVIDYGLGNLRSVQKAFEFTGYECVVTKDSSVIASAKGIVLPGVGAFELAMRNLSNCGLTGPVKEWIMCGKPFLGICLGFQMLFEYSDEGGQAVGGLGILKGSVKRFPDDMGLKVPQIGWNSLNIIKQTPLFTGIKNGSYVYFVHSYYVEAEENSIVASKTEYGLDFDSAVSRDNLHATQFHPEKSGDIGLGIIRNFGQIAQIESEGGKR